MRSRRLPARQASAKRAVPRLSRSRSSRSTVSSIRGQARPTRRWPAAEAERMRTASSGRPSASRWRARCSSDVGRVVDTQRRGPAQDLLGPRQPGCRVAGEAGEAIPGSRAPNSAAQSLPTPLFSARTARACAIAGPSLHRRFGNSAGTLGVAVAGAAVLGHRAPVGARESRTCSAAADAIAGRVRGEHRRRSPSLVLVRESLAARHASGWPAVTRPRRPECCVA